MTLAEDPELPTKTQMKALTQQATNLVRETGQPVTPLALLLALMALMAQAKPATAGAYTGPMYLILLCFIP